MYLENFIHFLGNYGADYTGVDETLSDDPVRKNVKCKLLLAIQIRSARDPEFSGSHRVYDVFARFRNFADQMHEIVRNILLPQMPSKIYLKLCGSGFAVHV
jgi:hypothetical protein